MGGRRVTTTDVGVGKRIRAFRPALGLSQTELGDQIGVTFQQTKSVKMGRTG